MFYFQSPSNYGYFSGLFGLPQTGGVPTHGGIASYDIGDVTDEMNLGGWSPPDNTLYAAQQGYNTQINFMEQQRNSLTGGGTAPTIMTPLGFLRSSGAMMPRPLEPDRRKHKKADDSGYWSALGYDA